MVVSKVSLSIDEDVLAEVRERVGGRGVSAYVNDALKWQLQHERIGELLAEMDERMGPVPEEQLAEARQFWQSVARGDR